MPDHILLTSSNQGSKKKLPITSFGISSPEESQLGTLLCHNAEKIGKAKELTTLKPQPMSDRSWCINNPTPLPLTWDNAEVCVLFRFSRICPLGLSSGYHFLGNIPLI